MSYFKNTPAKIRVLQDGREKSQVANDYSVLNNIFDLCNLKVFRFSDEMKAKIM